MPIERIPTSETDPGTCLHLVPEPAGGVTVWLDTVDAVRDGVCLGWGMTREEAIRDAIAELFERQQDMLRHVLDHARSLLGRT